MKQDLTKRVRAEVRQRDQRFINSAAGALADLHVDESVMDGFRSLTGERYPLRLPAAADACARRELARCLASRVIDDTDFGAGISFGIFTIANPNWSTPAECARVPLQRMEQDTLPRLKRRRAVEFIYAPAVLVVGNGATLRVQPKMRFLAYGYGLDEGDAAFIDVVRRDFKGARDAKIKPLGFQPLTRDSIKRSIFRMLSLAPAPRGGSKVSAPDSNDADNLKTLVALMINAMLPLLNIVGGTGKAKQAVSAARSEWKAGRRLPKKTIVEASEIPSLLSKIPLGGDGERYVLPFWSVQ